MHLIQTEEILPKEKALQLIEVLEGLGRISRGIDAQADELDLQISRSLKRKLELGSDVSLIKEDISTLKKVAARLRGHTESLDSKLKSQLVE